MKILFFVGGRTVLILYFLVTNSLNAQKVSQFDRAGFCDFLIDKNGGYHAVFQESPNSEKPTYIYYSFSNNNGASWSKPVNLSNDNTGNGSGYARILQDGGGRIYVIWKRYGNTASGIPIQAIVDGPGGYAEGTLFYKVLSAGAWSNAVQINEVEETQNSWFATVSPQGAVYVFWLQVSPESRKNKWLTWYYNDYLRYTSLNGTAYAPFADLNRPAPPEYPTGPPLQKGALNLHGYLDDAMMPHFIYESLVDNAMQLKYYDGKSVRVVYSYPKHATPSSYLNPPKLLVDDNGIDHVIFKPDPVTLENEQVWDINLKTNQTIVLAAIQKQGVEIKGFQAYQGPRGAMAIILEAGHRAENIEAYGLFYKEGKWNNLGLTQNAAKQDLFYKEFMGVTGRISYISTLTRYNSTFAAVAYDPSGNKKMLMTLSARWSMSGYSTDSPSILFYPID